MLFRSCFHSLTFEGCHRKAWKISCSHFLTPYQRESSATILSPPTPYEQASPPKRQKLIEFDCRGLEFVEFKPEGEWLCTGLESGTKFAGISFEEGDWYEYDEKANDEVSIKDLKFEIRKNL